MEIVVKAKDKKSKYFADLSKNSIVDLSNSSNNSQISLLGGKHIQSFLLAKYGNDDIKEIENINIDSLENSFKKIKNSRVAKIIFADVENFPPNNETERAVKNIYRYILGGPSLPLEVCTSTGLYRDQ
ncbi:hypothetical protein RMATCC62417_14316 [Rhizopus microsporus]|nr:hypothetical protein RMATCC62417_14316 [Rhizopus microsporus]